MAEYRITFFDTTFPTDEVNHFTTVLGLKDTSSGEESTATLEYVDPGEMVHEFYGSPFGASNTLEGLPDG